MKVVFIGPFAFYPKGTVIVRVLPLAKAVKEHGYEVLVLLPPYDAPQYSGVHFEVNGVNFYNVVIPKSRLPLKYLYVAACLVKKALEFKPDVVHVFKPKGYSGLAGMILVVLKFLRFTKVRLVVDSDDWEGYGGFADFYLKHKMYPKLMADFFDFQERWLLKRADAVTVASRTLESRANDLRKDFGVDGVFYVPNGIGELSRTDLGKAPAGLKRVLGIEGKLVILLYTRFFEYDVEQVIDILSRVISKVENVRLLVVGKGEFGEEERLLELARERGLLDYVAYVGWVRPKEIRLYIAVADVAIYPFKDTLLNRSKCPGKLVHLMSYGKAVVVDRVGQIAEYIEDRRSGILVEPGNVEQFSEWVVKLLGNRRLRKTLGENARKRIRESYNWTKLAKEVELAYELVLRC